jgi:hypothetical protein
MVITGTEKTEAAANEAKDRHKALGLPSMAKVYDTDTVAGLKPGLFVVSPAVVSDKATAETMAEGYAKLFEGSYVKGVTGPTPASFKCSRSVAGDRPDPRCVVGDGIWRAIIVFDRTGQAGSEDWGDYSHKVMSLGTWSGVDAKRADDGSKTSVQLAGKEVGSVDVNAFADHGFGYVYAMEGKPPAYGSHAQVDGVVSEAEEYFEMNLYQPLEMEYLDP